MKRKRDSVAGEGNEPKKLTAACTACRKQKIKCEMENDEPPCLRCKRRELRCILHTARRHPLADQKQIGLIGQDLANLYASVKQICQQLNIQPPLPLMTEKDTPRNDEESPVVHDADSEPGEFELSPPSTPLTVGAPIDTYLTTAQQDSMPDATSSQRPRARRKTTERPDMITKGLISQTDADGLVQRYLSHLDRFLYGIASVYRDADHMRRASPTLLAAVCAVTAFQDVKQQELFETCNREYRALIAVSTFENRSIDYILALCIGSFFLPDPSRILSSEAIRRAADCRLHLYFDKIRQTVASPNAARNYASGFAEAKAKLRLWYLLYICDQHLSILHNRDPLLRPEKEAIEQRDMFLADPSPAMAAQDARLMSQVSLLVIMSQTRDIFGSERSKPVSKSLSVQFSHFSRELDQWYTRYSTMLNVDPFIGAFPLTGLTMHYHFSKLYLHHHVFRGLEIDPIPPHFITFAMDARDAALNIFNLIMDNENFRNNILGVPAYFLIMISFAGHFLLDVCTRYREQLNAVIEDDLRKVSNVVAFFAQKSVPPQHPVARVLSGLMRALNTGTTNLGMGNIMSTSPFANIEWTDMTEFNENFMNAPNMQPFDMQITNGLPDDFYAGFGNPVFNPVFQNPPI